MPKYMYSGNYTAKGAAGLLEDGGTARRQETVRILTEMGGSLESYYWCYGNTDFIMIADLPSESAAIKLALSVGASGVFNGNLTPLISVADMDAAVNAEIPSMSLPGE
ncbi:MAG: GYD domain-containing protein [Candidatus Poseidoniaceae archaeon]